MIKILIHITFLVGLSCVDAVAQVERLYVETYYISEGADATDTIGGHLDEGSTTYRIFVDLSPGAKLLAIYGDENHPLIFTSTAPFFNHDEEGITFGKDLSKNRYEIGTVALDSYITLGQCSRSFSQGAYFGVRKDHDSDGSIIGGVNNDGGSAEIEGGLLNNQTSQIGFPLSLADGLVVSNQLPTSWIDVGFIDLVSNKDTTIFGSANTKAVFNRTNAILRNAGITGVDSVENEILVAQLTTKGEISFSINLEVEILIGRVPKIIKYVAQNEMLGPNEIFSSLLTYPFTCGCKDPDYLEASTIFACEDNSQCKTLLVFGCTDSLACNYNPDANFDIQDLCCYVGYCHDLDIRIVCPDLRPRAENETLEIILFPNPVLNDLYLDMDGLSYTDVEYTIYTLYGVEVEKGTTYGQDKWINVASLQAGYYTLKIKALEDIFILPFVKL
ncbi:MAG: T9SS type A sorting domain-containing protein [Saprospiraceae bacterium]|nr:T9SS type A sorting domain-containing protein [Saprospiraceae bacterium]